MPVVTAAKPQRLPKPPSLFPKICKARGLPAPEPEWVFAMPRRWRFDWAWPTQKVALEVEGGVWIQGRHSRGAGMVKDMEKYNRAAALGWRVLRVTPNQLALVSTYDLLRECLG